MKPCFIASISPKTFHSKLSKLALVAMMPLATASMAQAANITVTTTQDVVANDKKCSLREAVALVNEGIKNKNSDCYPEDENPTNVIELNTKKTYELDSAITISASATIQSDLVGDLSNRSGKKIATITAKKDRAFVVDDGIALQSTVNVSLKGLEIQGVYHNKSVDDAKNTQITQGGLIYNRERLSLEKVRLLGGAAKQGGAIYNASLDATLALNSIEIIGNYAEQGSGVFSENYLVIVVNSLFNKNLSTLGAAQAKENFVMYTLQGYKQAEISDAKKDKPYQLLFRNSSYIINSIFYDNNNTGAFNLKPGMLANNVTVVSNGAGVTLDSHFDTNFTKEQPSNLYAARLANSVLLDNTAYDISVNTDDLTFVNNLVYAENKLQGSVKADYGYALSELSAAQTTDIVARDTITVDGKTEVICKAPSVSETTGLFCPLIKQEDEFVANIKPRLLMSYQKLDESLIINKGKTSLDKGNTNALNCEVVDMRGEERTICDLGAFELNIDKSRTGNVKETNAKTPFLVPVSISLKDVSGDGQLIPASECPNYIRSTPTEAGQWLSGKVGEWTDGCILFRKNNAPKKGTLRLADGKDKLIYQASRRFHGTDEFEYSLITTTSRFSESLNDRNIKAKTTILQHPSKDFESETIELGYGSGTGSAGLWLLALLGGLSASSHMRIVARRKRK